MLYNKSDTVYLIYNIISVIQIYLLHIPIVYIEINDHQLNNRQMRRKCWKDSQMENYFYKIGVCLNDWSESLYKLKKNGGRNEIRIVNFYLQ